MNYSLVSYSTNFPMTSYFSTSVSFCHFLPPSVTAATFCHFLKTFSHLLQPSASFNHFLPLLAVFCSYLLPSLLPAPFCHLIYILHFLPLSVNFGLLLILPLSATFCNNMLHAVVPYPLSQYLSISISVVFCSFN